MKKPDVVIVGQGHASTIAMEALRQKDFSVTIVDDPFVESIPIRPYHVPEMAYEPLVVKSGRERRRERRKSERRWKKG